MVSSFLFSSKILAFLRVATDFVLKIRKFFFSTFPPSYFRNMLICCLVASKMVVVVFSNPLISLFMLEHKIFVSPAILLLIYYFRFHQIRRPLWSGFVVKTSLPLPISYIQQLFVSYIIWIPNRNMISTTRHS